MSTIYKRTEVYGLDFPIIEIDVYYIKIKDLFLISYLPIILVILSKHGCPILDCDLSHIDSPNEFITSITCTLPLTIH